MSDLLSELRDSARQVITGAELASDEKKTWQLLTELGWLQVSVPERLGGLGLGAQGACVLQAELGRGLSPAPFMTAVMALDAVCHSTIADKTPWVKRLIAGQFVAGPLAEPELDLINPATGGPVLGGLLQAVESADSASHALVWTSDASCVALAPLDQPAVELISRPTWDTTRRLFDLRFNDAALAGQHVLASGPAARELVARLQALRDFALAADSLGGGAALLVLTVEHLQNRRQFGRPLSLFQALRHRCADLQTQLAGAEAMFLGSLAAVGDPGSDLPDQITGKKAKLLACAAFSSVAEEALQLHGGIGMAAEHPCHLFLKRAMLNQHLGTGGDYAAAVADHLLAAPSRSNDSADRGIAQSEGDPSTHRR